MSYQPPPRRKTEPTPAPPPVAQEKVQEDWMAAFTTESNGQGQAGATAPTTSTDYSDALAAFGPPAETAAPVLAPMPTTMGQPLRRRTGPTSVSPQAAAPAASTPPAKRSEKPKATAGQKKKTGSGQSKKTASAIVVPPATVAAPVRPAGLTLEDEARLDPYFLVGAIGRPTPEEVKLFAADVEAAAQYVATTNGYSYADLPIQSRRLRKLAIFRLAQETMALLDLDVPPILRELPAAPPPELVAVMTEPPLPLELGTTAAEQPVAHEVNDEDFLASIFQEAAPPEPVYHHDEPTGGGRDVEELRMFRHAVTYAGLKSNKARALYVQQNPDFDIAKARAIPEIAALLSGPVTVDDEDKGQQAPHVQAAACADCGHYHGDKPDGQPCDKQTGVDMKTTRAKYCGCTHYNPNWEHARQAQETTDAARAERAAEVAATGPTDSEGRTASERTVDQQFAAPSQPPPVQQLAEAQETPSRNVTDTAPTSVGVTSPNIQGGQSLKDTVAQMAAEKNAGAQAQQQPQAQQPLPVGGAFRPITEDTLWPDPRTMSLAPQATERRAAMFKRIQDYWAKTVLKPDGTPRTDLNTFSTSYRVGLAGRILGMVVDNYAAGYEKTEEEQGKLEERVRSAAIDFVNAHKPATGSLALESPEPNWEGYVEKCQLAGKPIGTPLNEL